MRNCENCRFAIKNEIEVSNMDYPNALFVMRDFHCDHAGSKFYRQRVKFPKFCHEYKPIGERK